MSRRWVTRVPPPGAARDDSDDAPAADTSGAGAWGSGCAFAALLLEGTQPLAWLPRGARVLEVGCGCGVAGVAVAARDATSRVLLTDGQPSCLSAAAANASAFADRCATAALRWGDVAAATTMAAAFRPTVVLGTDVGYDPSSHDALVATLAACCRPAAAALVLVEEARFRDVHAWFLEALEAAGFALRERADLSGKIELRRYALTSAGRLNCACTPLRA